MYCTNTESKTGIPCALLVVLLHTGGVGSSVSAVTSLQAGRT